MNFLRTNQINFRKLKYYPGKAAFLIIPVTSLMIVSVVLSSQSSNLLSAAEQAIFGSADKQNQYLTLDKLGASTTTGNRGGARTFQIGGNSEDTNYTETDVQKVEAVENVEEAEIVSQVPISKATATDLFSDKQFNLSGLSGISALLAGQFTDQGFNYTEGEPIPIILNSRAFNEMYQDWKGKTEVTVEFRMTRPTPGSDAPALPEDMPIKNRAIEYNEEELLGKEFTIEFGGLEDIQNYSVEPSEAGITYKQLTAEELSTKEQTRKDAISPYWNYDKLNTPIKYTFKVVGIIEDESSTSSYIPADFANKLMKDYIQNQIDARTATALSVDLLNSQFQGMSYDGVELKAGGFFGFGGGGRAVMMARPGGAGSVRAGGPIISTLGGQDNGQYVIPGLVVSAERSEDNSNPFIQSEATGELKDADVYSKAAKVGSTMFVKIDDSKNRGTVVSALNNKGYAYQDTSKSDVYDELASNLRGITIVFTIGFITISIAVVMFTMSKFVSESKKEIGIFRALGATKGLILRMFLFQAVLYGAIAYLIGLGVGVLTSLLLSSPANTWFTSFIDRTVGETLNVVNKVDSSVFTQIDWQAIGIFSLILFIILVLVAMIPSRQAANLSPVQAIKGE